MAFSRSTDAVNPAPKQKINEIQRSCYRRIPCTPLEYQYLAEVDHPKIGK